MRKAGLEETQAGIKIARRNINNLRFADDNTLMVESEEALKSLLMNPRSFTFKPPGSPGRISQLHHLTDLLFHPGGSAG